MRAFAAVAAATGLLAVAPAAQARPARAVLVSCDKVAREATFAGRMAPVPGTSRMAMRFVLLQRVPGGHWGRVKVPGFSAWHTSQPGRSRYVYSKRVEGLLGPSAYRVEVRFHWLDATGAVLHGVAHAASPACWVPDPRPNLEVASLVVRPSRSRYAVTVANTGRSQAPASNLALDLGDGRPALSAPVAALAPGQRQTVIVSGRACHPGDLLTATADADDMVEERNEDDNVLTATCP
jgi:hypothetical protein